MWWKKDKELEAAIAKKQDKTKDLDMILKIYAIAKKYWWAKVGALGVLFWNNPNVLVDIINALKGVSS